MARFSFGAHADALWELVVLFYLLTQTFSDGLTGPRRRGLCDARCREGYRTIAVPRNVQTKLVPRNASQSELVASRLASQVGHGSERDRLETNVMFCAN